MAQKESAFVETQVATATFAKTWPTTPQNTTHPNHHSNSNVTIVQYTLHMGKCHHCSIHFVVKLLCKHPNNKGQMGSQPITKLYFMKAKVEKKCSSSTLFTICTMAISANFTYFGKLQTNPRCCHQTSRYGQRIDVKRQNHACNYI